MAYFFNLFKTIIIRNITFSNRIFSTPNQIRFKDNVDMTYMETKQGGYYAALDIL